MSGLLTSDFVSLKIESPLTSTFSLWDVWDTFLPIIRMLDDASFLKGLGDASFLGVYIISSREGL